jgi:hypothetical protein
MGHSRSPLTGASPLCHVHPPVDVQRGAGDVARLGRREEQHGVRDVLGEPSRPSGIFSSNAARCASGSAFVISVSTKPGARS